MVKRKYKSTKIKKLIYILFIILFIYYNNNNGTNTLQIIHLNIILKIITKSSDNIVTLTMRYNNIITNREINPMIRRIYKPISTRSDELDKLKKLFS